MYNFFHPAVSLPKLDPFKLVFVTLLFLKLFHPHKNGLVKRLFSFFLRYDIDHLALRSRHNSQSVVNPPIEHTAADQQLIFQPQH